MPIIINMTLKAFKGNKHVLYQAMVAASVGMCSLVASIAMGFTSPGLPSMQKDPNFSITDEDGSWIGSVMPGCALLGSLSSGIMVDLIGRRMTYLCLTIPFMISWLIIATATTVKTVIIGRMLSGICVGIQAVAGSVLLPETVQLDLRDKMVFFPAFLGSLGILVSYAAGLYLSWRQLAWLGCFLCLPPAILLLPLPETPYFLTRSGKRDSSLAALKQLRQTLKEVEDEQKILDTGNKRKGDNNQSINFQDLFKPPNLWPVGSGIALMMAQQTTGISSVYFYSSTIFETAKEGLNPNTASTILGVMNSVGPFLSIYLGSRFKRRSMIALSTFITTFCLFTLSAFFWAQESKGWYYSAVKNFSQVPVIVLLTYIIGFSCGWSLVPWRFLGEGMPSCVRGLAASVIVSVNWISAFVITKTFQWSNSALGMHYTFLGYALLTFFNGSLIHRYMPETFGMSAAQVDELYLKSSKTKKQ